MCLLVLFVTENKFKGKKKGLESLHELNHLNGKVCNSTLTEKKISNHKINKLNFINMVLAVLENSHRKEFQNRITYFQ